MVQLNSGIAECFVHQLFGAVHKAKVTLSSSSSTRISTVWIPQRAPYLKKVKNMKNCGKIALKRNERDMMSASATWEFTDGENYGRSLTSVLYMKDVLEMVRRQILMALREEVFFILVIFKAGMEMRLISFNELHFVWVSPNRLYIRWSTMGDRIDLGMRKRTAEYRELLVMCKCTWTKQRAQWSVENLWRISTCFASELQHEASTGDYLQLTYTRADPIFQYEKGDSGVDQFEEVEPRKLECRFQALRKLLLKS